MRPTTLALAIALAGCGTSDGGADGPAPGDAGAADLARPHDGGPMTGGDPGDPKDPDHYDTYQPPAVQWDDAPATHSSNGVDFIDPAGALASATPTATPVDPSTLSPPLLGMIAGFDLEPSGPLASIVFVRLPLPAPRQPGELLALVTLDPTDEDPWYAQSIGRVLADGERAIFALRHFSGQAIDAYPLPLQNFILGKDVDCSGGGPDDPNAAYDRGDTSNGGKENDPDGVPAIEVAWSHDLGRCVLPRLTDADPGLLQKYNWPNIDPPPHDDEDFFGDPGLIARLNTLADQVDARSCGQLRLAINETFDSDREHANGSTHYEGRAVDISPIHHGYKFWPAIGRVASIAEHQANFGWVYFEPVGAPTPEPPDGGTVPDGGPPPGYGQFDHVHASIPRELTDASRQLSLLLTGCHDRGVTGLVRSLGGDGSAAKPGAGGHGGGATFATQKPAIPKPTGGALAKSCTVAHGQSPHWSGAVTCGRVAIHGTVTLDGDTSITSGFWVWVAPDGAIVGDGKNLTIDARAEVRVDGLIDLSASAPSAPGGTLTVYQSTDLGPVLEIPSLDLRGGDGYYADGGPGGGVAVAVMGDDDVVFGAGAKNPGPLTMPAPAPHVAQGGNSWMVTPASGFLPAIVTGGGVGGFADFGIPMSGKGFAGGAGGNVTVAVPPGKLLSRTFFLATSFFTGGTPNVAVASPVEVYRFSNPNLGVGPAQIGVGGAGGRGYESFGNNNGGDGGDGGPGGSLSLLTGAPATCPDFSSPGTFSIDGLSGQGTGVGTGYQASGDGCQVAWSVAGGSGGANGGSGSGFPGFPGNAGAAAVVTLPK